MNQHFRLTLLDDMPKTLFMMKAPISGPSTGLRIHYLAPGHRKVSLACEGQGPIKAKNCTLQLACLGVLLVGLLVAMFEASLAS